MKILHLFCAMCISALCLVSCDLETDNTPKTQQELSDLVTDTIKASLANPEAYKEIEMTIDTVYSNSVLIDYDVYPHLYGAALYMGVADKSVGLLDLSNTKKDRASAKADLDSVRVHMIPVIQRFKELEAKDKEKTIAGFMVCVEYQDGTGENKDECYYYDVKDGSCEKKSWDGKTFGVMLGLLDEFLANPEYLEPMKD